MKYSKKIGTKEHYLQVNNHMGKNNGQASGEASRL